MADTRLYSWSTLLATVAFIFLHGIPEGACIPASHLTCESEFLRVKAGEVLSLECGSECTGSLKNGGIYEWWRVAEHPEEKKVSLEWAGASLTINPVGFEDGGPYVCKCLDDGPECQYNVSILPEMSFTASVEATHIGDTFDLSCIVEGYPSNISVIKEKYGVRPIGQIRKKLGEHKLRTFAVIGDAEESDYVCSVETWYKGKLVGKVDKSVSISIYNPPSIVYTTEFIIHSPEDYGKQGELTCMVHTTSDSESHVAWWANGTQLESNRKYTMDHIPNEENDIVKFRLIINNLQQSDIGSYLCQLSSDYDVEDTQAAWVQVDFRKDKQSGQAMQDTADGGEKSSGVLFIAIYCLLAACCIGVVYKVLTRGKAKHMTLIGYPNGGRRSGSKAD